MGDRGIEKKIAALSEELVLLEPSDPRGLADLHTGFEEIGRWADDASQPKVAVAAAAATKLIEDVVIEEAPDPEAAIDTVGTILSALQAIICEGRNADEVDFPPEVQVAAGQSEGVTDGGEDQPSNIDAKPSFLLPAHIDDTIFADFLARQGSVLQEMEALVLEIEITHDEKTVDALRRIAHTLKGESALLGLADVEQLCHATEDALGEHDPASLVAVLLGLKDWLGRAFDFYSGKSTAPAGIDALLARLTSPELQNGEAGSTEPAAEAAQQDEEPAAAAAEPTALEGDPELLGDFVSEAVEHVGSVHIVKDITDRKRAEEERLQKEKLQAALEMAGAACHELNQPLQAIMGYAELLVIEVSEEDESPQKLLRRIREQVARMAHITRKLNNITRYRARDYLDDVKIIDLDEASAEVHAGQAATDGG